MQDVASVIKDRFERGLAETQSSWSLVQEKTQAFDVINHVLRVILQLGYFQEYIDEFEALLAYQHSDGGWSDLTSGKRSGIRNTCFATRNLIRVNRLLQQQDFRIAIERAIQLVMSRQNEEGFWKDSWGQRDATSSSMGLLIYALKEQFGERTEEIHANARRCLARAVSYLERTQASDGSWPDVDAYEAPIGPTGHLLPKLVLCEGKRTPAVEAAIDLLVCTQEEDGSWDQQHTDHTCDATRALLLTYSIIPDRRLPQTIERGVNWLLEHQTPDGFWSEHPGEEASLLLLCDVLDCFSKYEAHRQSFDLRAFWE